MSRRGPSGLPFARGVGKFLPMVFEKPQRGERPLPARRIAVAPMMERTDRHDRYFLRRISRHAWLYTEMVATGAILHGDAERFLRFHPEEHPLALQLGGSEPDALAAAARIGAEFGYDEINLNIGCPSDRVQRGRFGACLMTEPERVADCVRAMGEAVDIPVTVKTRIGVDAHDSYDFLAGFIGKVAAAGCRTVIVHARKAYLQGLSPKENRSVPPLRYDVVYRLKDDFPDLEILLNGGVESLEAAETHLSQVDGVMIGRAAYQNPYLLAGVDRRIYGETAEPLSREAVVQAMVPYLEAEAEKGVPISRVTRHLYGLFNGVRGARAWRQTLSERAILSDVGAEILLEALDAAGHAQPQGGAKGDPARFEAAGV